MSQLTTAETLSPGVVAWFEWSAIIPVRRLPRARCLSRGVEMSPDRSHLVAHATRKSEHLLQLRRQRWFRRPLCVPPLSVHHGEHLLLLVVLLLQREHLLRRTVNTGRITQTGEVRTDLYQSLQFFILLSSAPPTDISSTQGQTGPEQIVR